MNQPLESTLQERIVHMLVGHGWKVKVTHGSAYQSGVPDLWLWHEKYDYRWVDTKREKKYKFTNAQLRDWYVLDLFGGYIWILTGPFDKEYKKLFKPPNWQSYLRKADYRRIEDLKKSKDVLLNEAYFGYDSNQENIVETVRGPENPFDDLCK